MGNTLIIKQTAAALNMSIKNNFKSKNYLNKKKKKKNIVIIKITTTTTIIIIIVKFQASCILLINEHTNG